MLSAQISLKAASSINCINDLALLQMS
jgi:hypothetical protein